MTITSNTTEILDPFRGVPAAIECWKLNITGIFVVCLLFISLSTNSTLLWVFYKNKELRTPLNVFVIATTAINLFASIFEYTFIISSNFACK